MTDTIYLQITLNAHKCAKIAEDVAVRRRMHSSDYQEQVARG